MKRVLQVLLALVVAAVFSAVVATPAQATVRWGCPSGVGCVFTGYSGNGSKMVISVGQYGVGVCHNLPAPFNNAVSSLTDDYGSDLDILLYINPNCDSGFDDTLFSGECEPDGIHCGGTDSGQWNLNTISTVRFDNQLSSFKIRLWE